MSSIEHHPNFVNKMIGLEEHGLTIFSNRDKFHVVAMLLIKGWFNASSFVDRRLAL
jgi:hypothetical protein